MFSRVSGGWGRWQSKNRRGECNGLIVSKDRRLGKLRQAAKSVLLVQRGLRWTYSNRRQVPERSEVQMNGG